MKSGVFAIILLALSAPRGAHAQPTPAATPPTAQVQDDSLPPASSALPILSVVGFGVLVGGVISAMKTR